MARHTAKSHKIRKVEILVIQNKICDIIIDITERKRGNNEINYFDMSKMWSSNGS